MTGTGARAQPSFSRLFVSLITSFPRLCLRPEGMNDHRERRPKGTVSTEPRWETKIGKLCQVNGHPQGLPLILSFPSVVLPVPPCSRRTLASRLISSVRPEGPGSARHEGNEGGNDRGNRVTGARDRRDRTEMSRE